MLGTFILGLTLLQDPDGLNFLFCKNFCPLPTHKTLKTKIEPENILAIAPSTLPSNTELGEIVKTTILNTLTPQKVSGAKLPLSLTVHFDYNSYRLSDETGEELKKYVKELSHDQHSLPLTLDITGFTDSKGSKAYNDLLAKKRAREVAKAVINLGYKNFRVSGVGKCCYADPESESANNRRVEIHPAAFPANNNPSNP
ncbi:MAG: OmpA family protein [Nitrospiria bacterium]